MRRYGAGTVFRRADGKFVAMWDRPRENGKRRRGSRVAETEAEAWRKMRAAQGSSSSKSRPPTGSLGAFLDEWLRDDAAQRKRRERTVLGYRAMVSRLPGEVVALDLSSPHLGDQVQRWLDRLDRHPRTVHHYAACLRAAFAHATRRGLMAAVPVFDLPEIPRAERVPLNSNELRAFLDAEPDPLWITAGWTGMRQGELLGLRWQDVSLERATATVYHSLARLPRKAGRGHTRYELTLPKTPKSRRTIPLLPVVVDALRPLRKEYLRNPPKLDQGLVFCTPAGSPLDASKVSRRFVAALARAGMPRVRFHDLRHGAASLLIESGADLATVAAILGHSNIGTTVDLYGHLTESHKRTAMERLVTA